MYGEGVNEIQTIYTRADYGTQITGGVFQLSLVHLGINDLDPETVSITRAIRFDATPGFSMCFMHPLLSS